MREMDDLLCADVKEPSQKDAVFTLKDELELTGLELSRELEDVQQVPVFL